MANNPETSANLYHVTCTVVAQVMFVFHAVSSGISLHCVVG